MAKHDPGFDKTAVVTGSSTGIGKAIAVKLASTGYNLVLHGRDNSVELDTTKAVCEQLNVNVNCMTCDFLTLDSPTDFFEQITGTIGKIDVWINNAGLDVLTGDTSQRTFECDLQQLFDVDVRTTLLLSRLAGKHMVDSAGKNPNSVAGSIVNIGWDQAFAGICGDSGQLFSTTKGAVMAMTGSLAKSLAPNVRVNCIAPGWIKTEWGETASESWQNRAAGESLLCRWGTPQDVANVVAFLASSESEFINGQIINVNGGFAGSIE